MKKTLPLAALLVIVLGAGAWILWQNVYVAADSADSQQNDYSSGAGNNIPTSADDAPPGSIHNLPVPQAVSAVKKYAAETLGITEGKVIVMTAYEKEWPDGCLGLASAGEFCTQVITPGYELAVQANGKEYVYRTNSDGSVIRLEK
ncbi:MAG: hypothetical protein HY432_03075 [Candidatus Liptonbacteria bacterium]|nr:hypothetical protein [Candidatus Liptonbacteria bacterium]